jgi:hypothetical protein
MTLLVIGATPSALQRVSALAPAGVRVVEDARSATPDWILVATGDQRAAAVITHGLAPFRIVEMPALASDDEVAGSSAVLQAILVKMAGIGPSRPLISSMGVALVRPFVRRRVAVASAHPMPDATLPTLSATGMVMSTVPGRIPAGTALDEHLASRARERVKRIAALAVRWTANKGS